MDYKDPEIERLKGLVREACTVGITHHHNMRHEGVIIRCTCERCQFENRPDIQEILKEKP